MIPNPAGVDTDACASDARGAGDAACGERPSGVYRVFVRIRDYKTALCLCAAITFNLLFL